MKRFWIFLLAVTLLLSACGPAATPSPVPTAVHPTETPLPPTETPVPPAATAAPRTLTDLESQGRLGAAAGAGFYDYDGGSDAAAERDRRLTAVLRVLAEA